MAIIARFKTAYDQKEVVLDTKVTITISQGAAAAGSNAVKRVDNEGKEVWALPVGTIVEVSGDAIVEVVNPNGAYHASVPTPDTVTSDMYIIAQSDATMSGRHIPTETLSYKYIGKEDFVAASSVAKPVALFKINDPTDLVLGTR